MCLLNAGCVLGAYFLVEALNSQTTEMKHYKINPRRKG